MVSTKKKHKKQDAVSISAPPVRAQFPAARNAVIISIAALAVLWLIQYFSVLTGGGSLWEDVIQLEYPYRYFSRMAFLRGEFPHWNPYTFGGMPFYATGTGILYPFNTLIALLPVGDAAFWRIIQTFIVLHVLIAGVAMFAYLKYKERTNAAAVFGAVAFMLGGYMITRVIHTGILYIVAWLPLMLMLLEKGVREAKLKHAVIGGLILGAVMQVGHAQVMFYAIGFLFTFAVYFVLTSLMRRSGGGEEKSTENDTLVKRTVPAVVFFAIAAGLCLVLYLPMFEAGAQTSRISYTMNDASEGSLQFSQLVTALMPKFFGANTGGDDTVPVFWLRDSFVKHNYNNYYNYWETGFYFGISTLVLSIFMFGKIKKDRSIVFFTGWILLSFLVALGGNFFFYKLLFSLGIPGFNSFRHTPRILFIWGFLFPVMAAAALDSLEELKSSKRIKTILLSTCAVFAVFGIITAAGGLITLFPQMDAVAATALGAPVQEIAVIAARARLASDQGMILAMNALLLLIVLTLFFTNKIKINTAKILIIICLAVDMLIFAAGQHITGRDGAHVVFARAASDVENIKKIGKDEIFRVNTRQYVVRRGERIGQNNVLLMERNQGYVSAIEITEGYNSFRLKYAGVPFNGERFGAALDIMNIKYYVDPNFNPQSDAGGNLMLANETYLPRAKLFYKAKVVGAEGKDAAHNDSLTVEYMNSGAYDHRNEVVVTDPALSRFTGEGRGEARITKYKLNRIELDVDTDKEAILWLSEIWYPAWIAKVNGEKADVHRVNHSFRAVVVPAGKSKVVFKFDSLYFNAGALISLLTLISALGYLLVSQLNIAYRRPKTARQA